MTPQQQLSVSKAVVGVDAAITMSQFVQHQQRRSLSVD
jgi:hypothetical protein